MVQNTILGIAAALVVSFASVSQAAEDAAPPSSTKGNEVKSQVSGNGEGPAAAKIVEDALSSGEVAETIRDQDLKIEKDSKYWGVVSVFGKFSTTEVSGCWTDRTFLTLNVELFEVNGMLVGRMSKESQTGSNAPLFHNTGPRCGNSDQGPVVTERESIEVLALGYHSKKEKGIHLMLEASDMSHWTLKSGGEVGPGGSWMQFYLPHMHAESGSDAGGFAGMFVSDEQIKSGKSLMFSGEVRGSGANTQGSVVLHFHPGFDRSNGGTAATPAESMMEVDRAVQ